MTTMNRKGRSTHPDLGKCVRVELALWEGAEAPGQTGRHVIRDVLFPKDQWRYGRHPRHLSGFDHESGERDLCVSPSSSYYADLCKYGEFRMAEPIASPE